MQARAGMRDTTFEIHRRTTSGWEITAVHEKPESAVQEAQRLFNEISGTLAVRVVRDLYDPATNTSKLNTVFRASTPVPDNTAEGYGERRRARRPAAAEVEAAVPLPLPVRLKERLFNHPYLTRGLVIGFLCVIGLVTGLAMGLLSR